MRTHAHAHLFMSVLMVKSALSMQMTFIMQMHANQTQPSENQGWEKIYTEILNERDRVKDKSFGWQEAANRTKRRVEEQGCPREHKNHRLRL